MEGDSEIMNFEATHSLLLLRKDSIGKNLTVNTIKNKFLKKTISRPYPVKRQLVYQEL